jgi:adenylate cyclase
VIANSGEILKRMGDGWIVTFGSVLSAIECATKTQEGLITDPKAKLRIGAHLGEIIEDEDDFYGAGVNLASRLESEAPPGGVMISQDLHRQLTGELSEAFTEAGSFELKNIPYPVTGFQWRPAKAGTDRAGELPTIYVEPLKFAPADEETGSAASEIHEQMVMALSKRTGIRLVTPSENGSDDPIYTIGGRLRMSGSQGRLSVSINRLDHSGPLFSQNYQCETSDIFAFIDEVVQKVTADIRIQVNAFDGDRLGDLADDELSISELRSRTASLFYKGTVGSWEKGRALMDRAVEMNPRDPIALAMRCEARVMVASARYQDLSTQEIDDIEADLELATQVAPASDFVFFVRSHFQGELLRDADAAIREAKRAFEINPAYVLSSQTLAGAYMLIERFDDAVEVLNAAITLSENDPFVPTRYFILAVCHYCLGQFDKALEQLSQATQRSPNLRAMHTLRAICSREAGDDLGAEKSEKVAARLPRTAAIVTPRPLLPAKYDALLAALAPDPKSTA